MTTRDRRTYSCHALVGALAAVLLVLAPQPSRAQTTLRIGHLPDLTQAQALVAEAMSRAGHGWFEGRLGSGVTIDWHVYNAGPSAMDALSAHALDLSYVGPDPALELYARSDGGEVRIVGGDADGGAALVVQPDEILNTASDFFGMNLGTPQLGNTEDVAARAWLAAGGVQVTPEASDASVKPTANPEALRLFKQRQLDAMWTVEPWVSLLAQEAGGKATVERPQAITALLVARADFLAAHRDLVRNFVAADQALTDWIIQHPDNARDLAHKELLAETTLDVSPDLIEQAWKRITLVHRVERPNLEQLVRTAQTVGFLRGMPDLSRLVAQP